MVATFFKGEWLSMSLSSASSRRTKKRRSNGVEFTAKEVKRQWVLIVISVFYVIYGLIFNYVPLAGWIMAFQNYKLKTGIFHSKFVGLDKFKFLFTSSDFIGVVRNTFCMGALNLIFSTITAIGFAILLNEIKNLWGKKIIQTVSYLPHFLSWIVVCGIVSDALSTTGIINELLIKFHILDDTFLFLGSKPWFWPIVTLSHLWKETGWNAIIYLAAITSIDPALYESASIDGAGRFQKMWYVTLPSLRPTIMILLLMNIGNVLNAGFEIQYILGNDVVRSVSRTIDIYVLQWAMDGTNLDFSLGTAAGVFKTLVSIVLIVAGNTIAKKTGDERLF